MERAPRSSATTANPAGGSGCSQPTRTCSRSASTSVTSSCRESSSASSGNTSGRLAQPVEGRTRGARRDDFARAPDPFGQRRGNARHVYRGPSVEEHRRESRMTGQGLTTRPTISENPFDPLGICRGFPALQVRHVLDSEPETLGIDLPRAYGTIFHFPDIRHALRGDLVHTDL